MFAIFIFADQIGKHQQQRHCRRQPEVDARFSLVHNSTLAGTHMMYGMRGPRKFCQRWSNFENVFFFSLMRGEMIQIALKRGHHRPARETPLKWRFAGGPMMALH